MKTTFFSKSVKMMAMTAMLVMGAMSASAKDIDTLPFDKVTVDLAAKVRVIDGDKYSVNVRSTDKDLAEDIKVSVENGVLGISAGAWSEDETTVITITCPTDIDVTTSHCFEAYDIESEPAAEEEAQPELPKFPFHHMPFHHFPMHRSWARA